MFCTKAAEIIAWLIFVPSVFGYSLVFVAGVLGRLVELAEAVGPRFVASSSTFGEGIAFGAAFGVAAEISRSISNRA